MRNYILVTGAAGFIGFYLCKKLLENGFNVIGIDNLNEYYDIALKEKRLEILNENFSKNKYNWIFIKSDLIQKDFLSKIFKEYDPKIVINLAAQAGVRYSLTNPEAYITSNIVGFSNLLECCRINNVHNLLYASSSSVYGGNTNIPFSEVDPVNHPVSLYAATKRSNELMAHAYSHLYNLPATGMRFFTVYGALGRPDMAPMIFTKAILEKNKIKIFNHGDMRRDFTFIDDIVEGIFKCCYKPANIEKESYKSVPYKIFNIGNSRPIELMEFIEILENKLSLKADKIFLDMQKGDVKETWADTSALKKWVDYSPSTSVEEGIEKLVEWYKAYYKI